jgi:putative serine protease PepD
MSMPPDPDDERCGLDPPAPDDRLWRHPSEIGAGVRTPSSWPMPPRRRRLDLRTVAMGAVAGACLAGGTVFVSMWAIRPTRPAPEATQSVAIQPISTAVATELPTEQLAHDLGPSLPAVRALHHGNWTAGTGIWIDARGTLLTAAPLVLGASEVVVTGQDGVPRRAKVMGTDTATGVAALATPRTSGRPLAAAAVVAARAGTAVAVLGAPSSVDGVHATDATTTLATVRTPSMRTSVATGVVHDAIQLDRPIPPDALGGVIVDRRGQVVGIAIVATDASGMSAGAPADWALSAGAELRAHGSVTRAWLGVEAVDLDPDTASRLEGQGGAQLSGVTPDGPAAAAGMRVGDVITAVDRQPTSGASELVLNMRRHRPGDRITLTLERGNHATTAVVTLGR